MSVSSNPVPRSSPKWLQFHLRSLFIAVFVAAVVAGWLRIQMIGRIRLGANAAAIAEKGSLPSVAADCPDADYASRLAKSFDRDQFIDAARSAIRSREPRAEACLEEVVVNVWSRGHAFFIEYDVPRWGRHRLDLSSFRYVFDVHDPVAQRYNDAANEALIEASVRVANPGFEGKLTGPAGQPEIFIPESRP